jgi:hypothetical protein
MARSGDDIVKILPTLGCSWLLVLMLIASSFGVACTQRKVVVRMRDEDGKPQRSFTDNAPSSQDLQELSEAYGHAPEKDDKTGLVSISGSFEAELPQELDGANGWSRMSSAFGHTTLWYEAPATTRDAWPRLVQRVESGILWLRILKRWAQSRYEEDRAELIDTVFEEEFIPGIVDGYLRWVGAGAIMSAQRVGLNLRKEENREEITADELFRLQVVLPLLIALATDGPLEPAELHSAFLIGIDGAASKAERDRIWKSVGKPAVLRFLQRFEPERTDITLEEIRSWGFSILLFSANTSRYKDLMLASPAVSEDDKQSLRNGGIVFPPSPFGVKFLGKTTPTKATLELEPSHSAFMTNGVMIPLEQRTEPASGDDRDLLRFEMNISPSDEGALFGSPPAYALWSTPDIRRQEAIFGSVVLAELDLAVIAGWETIMSDEDRASWLEAVSLAETNGSVAPLATFLQERLETTPPTLLKSVGLLLPPSTS